MWVHLVMKWPLSLGRFTEATNMDNIDCESLRKKFNLYIFRKEKKKIKEILFFTCVSNLKPFQLVASEFVAGLTFGLKLVAGLKDLSKYT